MNMRVHRLIFKLPLLTESVHYSDLKREKTYEHE